MYGKKSMKIYRCEKFTIATLLCIILILLPSCVKRLTVEPPDEETRKLQDKQMLAKIIELGKNGDWIIMRGYKAQDEFIVSMTATPLSHAAVLDRDRKQVIEALGKGVKLNDLGHFVHISHRVILIRPVWATGKRGDRALAVARSLVGKKYDFLGLVGINSKKRFYCTELAMYVYREFQSKKDHIPRVIEPGQMYLWGNVLYDSRPRN
jgi:hypothetical protein